MLVLAADIPEEHLPGQGSKAQFLSYRQKPRPQAGRHLYTSGVPPNHSLLPRFWSRND